MRFWHMGAVAISIASAHAARGIYTQDGVDESQGGDYRLEVRNASEIAESVVSNDFRIHVARPLTKWEELKWDGDIWW